MRALDAEATFASFVRSAGMDIKSSTPDKGVAAMCGFYREVRCADCGQVDGADALLFQWGTFDWGEGDFFELNITRQLVIRAKNADEIWQLGLTYRYEPAPELASLTGNVWCESVAASHTFGSSVAAHETLRAVAGRTPHDVSLAFEQAG